MLLRFENTVKFSTLQSFKALSSALLALTIASPFAFLSAESAFAKTRHAPVKKRSPSDPAVFTTVADKLRAQGVNSTFVRELVRKADSNDRETIVRANVFNFHQTTQPDYSGHFSDEAISKCASLIARNRRSFALAEKTYGVPASTIASLMWVETRHGKRVGKYSVANAYMNLATANDHALIEKLIAEFKEKGSVSDTDLEAFRSKAKAAAERKSKWAIEQLIALAVMRDRKVNVFAIKGSSAGAFGIPQFIPTSYLKWAKKGSTKSKEPPSLFHWDDAIVSVAFYLNNHGWSETDDNRLNALLAYNRSRDYAQIIMKISKAVDSNSQVASQTRSVATER